MSAFQWSRYGRTSSRMRCAHPLVRDKHISVSPLPDASAARTSPCIALKGGTPVLAGEPANRPGRAGMLLRSMYPYRDGHIYRYVYTCPAERGGAPRHLGWRTREWRRRYPALTPLPLTHSCCCCRDPPSPQGDGPSLPPGGSEAAISIRAALP